MIFLETCMECRFNTLAKQLSVWRAKYLMWGKIYSSQTNILQVRTTIWKLKIIIHFNIMFSEFQKTSHGPQFFFLGALIIFIFLPVHMPLWKHMDPPKSEGQFPNLGNRIIWLEFEPNCSSCCANSLRWLKNIVLFYCLSYSIWTKVLGLLYIAPACAALQWKPMSRRCQHNSLCWY